MDYIGIDISMEHFHASKFDPKTNQYQVKEWTCITETDLSVFANSLDKTNDWCVMEATGNYHFSLAYWLVEHGFQVSIINPLLVKRYRQMKGSITKTDKADAIFIAKYAQSESDTLSLFQIPSESLIKLSQRRMLLNSLQNQIQVIDNQIHALKYHPKADVYTKDFFEQNQLSLKSQILSVKQSISELIDQDYSQQKDLLLSIPGFGEVTSNAFIETVNTFDGIQKNNATKAFAKFVGLAPTIEHSGKSVRKQATIARSSCPLLRTKLYLPAITVCTRTKTSNIFKTFYIKLRANGKSFKEAIVAVMHKMVRVAITLIKTNTKFNPNFYSPDQPLICAETK